jgi:hypothetical protein
MVIAIADRLGKSISEVMEWPASELELWVGYLRILKRGRS